MIFFEHNTEQQAANHCLELYISGYEYILIGKTVIQIIN